MYYHKVEICGVNTAKLPVLKEKEKMELIVKAQAGDKEARQKMINGNLRLVLSVVQKFTGRGENLDDLFQVGCIGLIKAIDNFNPGLGLRFSTYGQPMIIGEIRRFLWDNNAMRVSRSVRDVAYKAMQARELLQRSWGGSLTCGRYPRRWACRRRLLRWRWRVWWSRFPCMSLYTATAATPSM